VKRRMATRPASTLLPLRLSRSASKSIAVERRGEGQPKRTERSFFLELAGWDADCALRLTLGEIHMLNRLGLKIVLAGATMLIGGVPALAHGSGSVGHSSHPHSAARVGASTKSIGPTSTRMSLGTRSITSPALAARMLVTTVPSVPTMTTASPKTSVAADPPTPGAAAASTSRSTMSGGARGGSSTDLSQFNPGAQDLATPAVSPPTTTDITDLVAPAATGLLTTDITTTTLLTTGSQVTTGSQILGVNGVLLPNAATSGAVAQAPTTAAISSIAIIGSQGEVIATSGGSSLIGGGASGRTMPECMAAWDKATHITKMRWRQLCADTLTEPNI
jgi:hypothetical protein